MSALVAVLGPTNTGKTHRAIERMLEFETGVIGLPLRLLAREVYDRVSTRVGEQAVALVTGEEKRVPPRARYWVCTAEAMPRDARAEFLAVDEIQLVGHPERGHVFTERMLHARGTRETWFLGAASVEGLLRRQLPELEVVKLPRLSELRHIGPSSLRTLPKRSAVVAFSMPEVYRLADALRRRRGGAAVVLGALSPRVRNAQVALYQAGEVDFLVATDAIGMGLNLDIDHVALAGTVKFDGFETRDLEPSELAQIAGRAGRHLRDGTFGTLNPEPELSRGLVQMLEQHRFPAQRFAYYRNAELDYSSLDALLRSLARRPRDDSLRPSPEGDDIEVLRCMAKRPGVADELDELRMRALWDICRVPNYEKRLPEHQAEALWPLFEQLAREGRLSTAYVEERVRRLEKFDGDMHALMDRLAQIRTWTYVSHQSGWLASPQAIQERTRELEDKLSDVLHERLLERFVDPNDKRRRSNANPRSPFAALATHTDEHAGWVERMVEASFAELVLEPSGTLTFTGEQVARIVRGQSLLRPALKLRLPDWVASGAGARIERRLTAHLRDLSAQLLGPLSIDVSDSAPLRGLSYQLEQGLGTTSRAQATPQLEALSERERAALQESGIVVGRQTVFARATLEEDVLRIREVWVKAWLDKDDPLASVSPDAPVQRKPRAVDRELALALGFVALPSFLVRCDALEWMLNLDPSDAAKVISERFGFDDLPRELPSRKKRRRRR
ncbi:MAG TPA: helicase-related protein [Polyangiales bacterium]|nr:helicase-related protein [Polyangiales bacterium]